MRVLDARRKAMDILWALRQYIDAVRNGPV
jgi:hypothetical protein